MWKMIRKHLEDFPGEAQKQIKEIEAGAWVDEYGVHASWQNLKDALQTYIDKCKQWGGEECNDYWVKKVGRAQSLLPAHVIHEYCRLDRTFRPCPEFKEETLPRTTMLHDGAKLQHSDLGITIGLRRDSLERCNGDKGAVFAPFFWGVVKPFCGDVRETADLAACDKLLQTRIEQRSALLKEYSKCDVAVVSENSTPSIEEEKKVETPKKAEIKIKPIILTPSKM